MTLTEDDDESDGEHDLAQCEIGDDELIDAIEEVALADEYKYQDEDFVDDIEDTLCLHHLSNLHLENGAAYNLNY